MAATAAAILVVWERSSFGDLLHHDEAAAVASNPPEFLLIALGAWTLMVVAMMLPTSASLVAHFSVVVRNRPERVRLLGLLIFGYLAVWASFGVVAHAGDLAVHRIVDNVPWLGRRSWLIGAGVFALAGTYQFSGLKERCLAKCRSPRLFIVTHWHGRNASKDALWLGVHHGIFCLGCCWALMLLMFAVAWTSLVAMVVLGVLMALEKNAKIGADISRPLGWALLSAATVLVAGDLVG